MEKRKAQWRGGGGVLIKLMRTTGQKSDKRRSPLSPGRQCKVLWLKIQKKCVYQPLALTSSFKFAKHTIIAFGIGARNCKEAVKQGNLNNQSILADLQYL